MTDKPIARAALFAIALAATTPARADEPGPGGTRPFVPTTGEQIYRSVCQACHMADGKGATGAAKIPALAKNPALASAEYPIMMITMGRGAMPWLTDVLNPAQIASVVTYVRTHFGNHYSKPVTVADVAKVAPKPSPTEH